MPAKAVITAPFPSVEETAREMRGGATVVLVAPPASGGTLLDLKTKGR
jgi:hypothetical protein